MQDRKTLRISWRSETAFLVVPDLGPWDEDEEDRFKNGPLAALGRYTVRLIVGDRVAEQEVVLLVDPRVADTGTTIDDINTQVALELKVVALLTAARKLEQKLTVELEKFEKKAESGSLSEDENGRLAEIEAVIADLKTADMIYPRPMLSDQISYLYNMISKADQAPGKEAEDRYRQLNKMFSNLKQSLNR